MTYRQLDALLEHRHRFLGFVRARMADREAAEDVLQMAFAKVVEQPELIPEGREVPWFYRVLRNAVIDRHRRQAAETRGREAWEVDPTRHADAPAGRVCRCTLQALAGLKPNHRFIIEQVDLHGRSVVDVARAEGLSTSNGYVRLHRARRLLSERLHAICRTCAETACVDCHCSGNADSESP
jgi:RNA polymerase sigma-70 factor (ECF subfamily)